MMSDFSFVLMPRDRKSIDVRRHKYIDQSVLNSVQLVNTALPLVNIFFSVCPPVSGGVDEVEVPETTAGSQEVFSHQRGATTAAEEQPEQVPAERHDGEQLQEGENPDRGT